MNIFSLFSARLMLLVLLIFPGIASHAETNPVGTITPAELALRLKEGKAPVIIDARSREEYAEGHIETALNLPYDELKSRIGEIPGGKSVEIVVYCRSGKRARIAEDVLLENGYTNIRDLAGHWLGWHSMAK